MTVPCDKGEILTEIKDDVKQIHAVVTAIATQNERITTLEVKSIDHEGRMRHVERLPVRAFFSVLTIAASIFTLWVSHKFLGG